MCGMHYFTQGRICEPPRWRDPEEREPCRAPVNVFAVARMVGMHAWIVAQAAMKFLQTGQDLLPSRMRIAHAVKRDFDATRLQLANEREVLGVLQAASPDPRPR